MMKVALFLKKISSSTSINTYPPIIQDIDRKKHLSVYDKLLIEE